MKTLLAIVLAFNLGLVQASGISSPCTEEKPGYGVGPNTIIDNNEAWILADGQIKHCYTLAHPTCYSPQMWDWKHWLEVVHSTPESETRSQRARSMEGKAGVWVVVE